MGSVTPCPGHSAFVILSSFGFGNWAFPSTSQAQVRNDRLLWGMFGFLGGAKPTPQALVDKRRYPRFTTTVITCSLGDVVDLSAGGIRLRGRGKTPVCRGQIIPITLKAHDSQTITKARVVHIRRVGLRIWEAGFAFVDLRPA